MKKCPKCNAEVEDNFDLCWNCQYSFDDERVLESSDFRQICPECNQEIETSVEFCPNCGNNLTIIKQEVDEEKPSGLKKLNCLRCSVSLNFKGNYKFHEGTSILASGGLLDLLSYRESFDLYSCPNCGKVEFFLPGFE